MRIEKLELNNFRGFEHLEIEFPKEEAGLAVLIGVNGSGKSSVLEAIVSFFEGGMKDIINPEYLLSEIDITLEKHSFTNSISVEYYENTESVVQSCFLHSNNGSGPLGILGGFYRTLFSKIEENSILNVPIICFYNAKRKNNKKEKKGIKRYLVPQLKAYENCLSAGLNFNDFEKWFIDRENNENREKIKQKKFSYNDKELQKVREGINRFFADWNIQNIRGEEREFNRKTNIPTSLSIEKNEKPFNLSQLSDGERMAILLVADIARRLTIANPKLENPLTGEGLVLIDEIDLHLHPAWQRKIIPNLRKTFPNIQFIVTTHSPQVLSSVPRENVVVLDNFKAYKSGYTEGRDSNSILAEVFGVPARPEDAKKELDKLYRLIDDPKKEQEAEQLLKKLKEKYGDNDPDLIQATLHLEFLTN